MMPFPLCICAAGLVWVELGWAVNLSLLYWKQYFIYTSFQISPWKDAWMSQWIKTFLKHSHKYKSLRGLWNIYFWQKEKSIFLKVTWSLPANIVLFLFFNRLTVEQLTDYLIQHRQHCCHIMLCKLLTVNRSLITSPTEEWSVLSFSAFCVFL